MQVRKWIVVLVAGMMMGVVTGMAASVTQGSTATFSVPTLIRLSLTTATVDFGALTEADYDRGYGEIVNAQGVAIWSNKDWTLTVAADAATWTAPWAKPSTDLLWRAATTEPSHVDSYNGSFAGMDVSPAQVAAGKRGGNIRLSMDFRVLVSWENDPAGDYSLGFTYTLTAP
ncbi:MAG: hypothetical protein NUV94_04570 [Candidatus Acetothermia bacterium]|jgi:hypothetical protein|nr:hypothetical protein [Candidatus Acetothermia bacterium]